MDADMCYVTVDNEYEKVGVEEVNEEIHNHAPDEFEPEETYIIPNAAPHLQHGTESTDLVNGEHYGF